ncbi:MAG: dephospho-CoA kinase [Hyphomicrobiales bacterium]
MITVGLTGSIASGKSEVSRILMAQGVPVFDSDAEVHDFYQSEEAARLLASVAPAACGVHGVDRAVLAALVKANPALLPRIESLVHPLLASRRKHFIASQSHNPAGIIVIDAPLLFEAGLDKEVDVTVVVSAPEQLRRARALARPSMDAEKLAVIEGRQLTDAEKRMRASFVIENHGSLEDLQHEVRRVLAKIRENRS